jgi:hypothetical protein
MRSVLCAVAVAVLVTVPAFAADRPAVRALNLQNVKLALPALGELREGLTEVRTADELAKSAAFADDASRAAVGKQVDFAKEKVVVVTWWGRSPSSVRVRLGKDGKTVLFTVVTANPALAILRPHAAAFAAPRDVPVAFGEFGLLLDLVREPVKLSLEGVKVDFARGGYEPKPLEIKSADELAKAEVFADEASRTALGKRVDFAKDKLVVFVWSGSGGDKLVAAPGKDGKSAVFTYTAGRTDDLRHHAHAFAVPRGWEVRVVK